MTPTAIPPEPGTGGVNAPHPSDEDPAKFFGVDGEDGEQEHSLMPDESEEQDQGTQEQPAAAGGEQEQPAAEEQGAGQEQPAAQAAAADPPKPAGGAQPTPGQQFDDGTGHKEVPVAPAGPAPAESAPPAPAASATPAAAPAAGAAPADGEQDEKKPSSGPRGYVVLREVALSREFLDHFISELDAGKDPRTAYFVLEPKVESRNPTPVLQAAFKKHHKRLGAVLRLGAIPLSAFKIRTIQLKPKVIDDNIEID